MPKYLSLILLLLLLMPNIALSSDCNENDLQCWVNEFIRTAREQTDPDEPMYRILQFEPEEIVELAFPLLNSEDIAEVLTGAFLLGTACTPEDREKVLILLSPEKTSIRKNLIDEFGEDVFAFICLQIGKNSLPPLLDLYSSDNEDDQRLGENLLVAFTYYDTFTITYYFYAVDLFTDRIAEALNANDDVLAEFYLKFYDENLNKSDLTEQILQEKLNKANVELPK